MAIAVSTEVNVGEEDTGLVMTKMTKLVMTRAGASGTNMVTSKTPCESPCC